MNLSAKVIHLFLLLQGIKLHGHLGTISEMGKHNPHHSKKSMQEVLGNKHTNRNDRHHHNDLHASFGKRSTATHGGKTGGVFGPTGNMTTNLLREGILHDLDEQANNGNIFAQEALDDIHAGRKHAKLDHAMGMLNKMHADDKSCRRRVNGVCVEPNEMRDLSESLPHSVGHMMNQGLEEMGGNLISEGNIADAIAAQEVDPKIAAAAAKNLVLNEGAKRMEPTNEEIAEELAGMQNKVKSIAIKAGEAAAKAALNNGASLEEAEEAGLKQEAETENALRAANKKMLPGKVFEEEAGDAENFNPIERAVKAAKQALANGALPEEAHMAGMMAATGGKFAPHNMNEEERANAAMAQIALGSDPKLFEGVLPKPRENQKEQAEAALKAEAAALENGATPEEARNAGLEAAKEAAAGGAAAIAGKKAHDVALENGATPEEAHIAGDHAAAMAGNKAHGKALENGATPEEAHMAGEQAAMDAMNALGRNPELAHAQAEEQAAKEEAKIAGKQNAIQGAAEEAAGEAAMESAASGLPEAKALTNADKAGREAAAGMAGEEAAAEAMEKGATPEEAEAIANLAADNAKALGIGAQVDPALHEANKQEEAANLAEAKKEIEESMRPLLKERLKGASSEIKAADTQEAFGVIGTVPDDSNVVNLSKGHLELPLKGFTGENPKTEEEKEAKKEQDALAEKLRNKITKNLIPSPLNVIKGEDGYMNIPESAKKIEIQEGTVYYPESAKDEMKNAGKDVSHLKHRFNVGERKDRPMGEGYYVADASGFEMDLPSPLNKSPLKVLSGKNGVLDISGASGIDIVSGKLDLIPWKQYSKGLHPEFNLENFSKKGFAPTKEQKEIEEQLETLANTKAEVITNPSGKQFVKFTPPVGVSEQIPINELAGAEELEFRRNNDSGQDGLSMLQAKRDNEPARSLNIAQNASHGEGAIEGSFEMKIQQNAKQIPEADLIVSGTNSFDPKQSKPQKKMEEKLEITEKTSEDKNDHKCPTTVVMLKNTNDILIENSEKFGSTLGMTESMFAKSVAKIPESAMKVFLQYDCDHNKKDFQEKYRKAYADLKVIFDKNAEPMMKIIGNVIRAAKQRSRPARVISTRVLRKPINRKVAVYPKVIRNAKTNEIISPQVISSKTITNIKPTLVEKKVLTPIKEVVIRKGPVLSNSNPPKLEPIKNYVVLDSKGAVVKESTQRDLPPNPK